MIDIGCAYGVAAIPAGAIAAELEVGYLAALSGGMDRVGAVPGVGVSGGTLGAVCASNVSHFLRGAELEIEVERVREWLAPGGMVFVPSSTP